MSEGSTTVWPVPPVPDERAEAMRRSCEAIARLSTVAEAIHYHDGDREHLSHLCAVVGSARQSVEELAGIVAGWVVATSAPNEPPSDQDCGAAVTDPGDDDRRSE